MATPNNTNPGRAAPDNTASANATSANAASANATSNNTASGITPIVISDNYAPHWAEHLSYRGLHPGVTVNVPCVICTKPLVAPEEDGIDVEPDIEQEACVILPCGHAMGWNCVHSWRTSMGAGVSCPFCRSPLRHRKCGHVFRPWVPTWQFMGDYIEACGSGYEDSMCSTCWLLIYRPPMSIHCALGFGSGWSAFWEDSYSRQRIRREEEAALAAEQRAAETAAATQAPAARSQVAAAGPPANPANPTPRRRLTLRRRNAPPTQEPQTRPRQEAMVAEGELAAGEIAELPANPAPWAHLAMRRRSVPPTVPQVSRLRPRPDYPILMPVEAVDETANVVEAVLPEAHEPEGTGLPRDNFLPIIRYLRGLLREAINEQNANMPREEREEMARTALRRLSTTSACACEECVDFRMQILQVVDRETLIESLLAETDGESEAGDVQHNDEISSDGGYDIDRPE